MEKEINIENLTSIAVLCGHCGVKARMSVVCEGKRTWDLFLDGDLCVDNRYAEEARYLWQIVICLACEKVNVIEHYSCSIHDLPVGEDSWMPDTELRFLYPSSKEITREGIYHSGQQFDALLKTAEILSTAKQSIVIIDGYIDDSVLKILTKKALGVQLYILTKSVSPNLKTFANAFNKQYGGLSIRTSAAFHDRFIFIDDTEFYHFGASIKDLGNKGFMFSRIEERVIVDTLRTNWISEWAKAVVEVHP